MWCRISGSIRLLPSWKRLPGRKKTRWNSSATSAVGRAAGTASAVMRWSAARTLGKTARITAVPHPTRRRGTAFPKPCGAPAFIGVEDIKETYLPMGFSNFKIEGRGLGSALVLEFLLYYLVKPEHQLEVREEIYLDNMLDLF